MCGATISASDGDKVINCDFCGSTQTIPNFDGGKKETYYKRALALRFSCDFDRARQIFEKIVSDFPDEAEAYWGIVLCKYGVEYVDDENTGLKIPTCHRTLDSFIFADPDYLNAIKYADAIASNVYKKEAEQIDLVQKGILKISMNEEPFDIFICYKENDYAGEQTKDSVYAFDIYKMLTNNGYKVFMSKVTLADKLGALYEPYIYSALKSSRVMIHVTTSIENTESVWVRNEWSRFIKFSSMTNKKVFIPCYAGVSPSELPLEIQGFQGQDLTKIGSLQNLLIGIEKIFGGEKKGEKEKPTDKYADLIDKGNKALEAESFTSAEDFFTKASYESKMPGEAYLGLLLTQFRVSSVDALVKNNWNNVLLNENYKLAKKFCDEKNKALKQKLSLIENSCSEKAIEYEYENKKRSLDFALPISSCYLLIQYFENHIEYKDSKDLLVKAKIKFIKTAQSKEDLAKAESMLDSLELSSGKEKDLLCKELQDKARSIQIEDLERTGLFIRIPKDKSIFSINLVIGKYASRANALEKATKLTDSDREIIEINENDVLSYLNQVLEAKSIGYADLETLKNIKEQLIYILKRNKETIFYKLLDFTQNLIDGEEEKNKNELAKKKRKKVRTMVIIFSIVGAVITGIIVGIVAWANGYAASNFSLKITNKTNDYEDYYSYHLTLYSTLGNNSPHDVSEVVYKITFYDQNNKSLAAYNISYSGNIKSKNSYNYTTEFTISYTDTVASKIWDLSFNQLTIKGSIISAYFSDGTSKTYNCSEISLK